MQINSYSGQLPLSTQVIQKAGQAAQSPNSRVNPEQVNSIVDQGVARAEEVRDNREQSQVTRRSAATQLYSAASQQQQLDIYLAVASEGETDSSQGSLDSALESRSELLRYELSQRVAGNSDRPELPKPSVEPLPYISTRV